MLTGVCCIFTLTGANPQILETCATYVELGATIADCESGLTVVIDATDVDMSTPGSYSVTPASHVEHLDAAAVRLYFWVNRRRNEFREGLLSADRIAALEAIEGWAWEPYSAAPVWQS